MKYLDGWKTPLVLLLAGWTAAAAENTARAETTIPAAVCNQRYGATATWSQGTDTAQANSFWWAEACAFRRNTPTGQSILEGPLAAAK